MNTPKLPPLPHWCEPGSPFAEQMQAYAIAAIEAQGVPDEQSIRAALRSALAWGRVYGEVIPAHQWDNMREQQIEQAMKTMLTAAPPAPQQIGQGVPDEMHMRILLARYENQWHRMGELWERCQGKGWPKAESEEFARLRDELTPATRALLLASAQPAPQAEVVPDGWYITERREGATKLWPITEQQALAVAAPQQAKPQPLSDEQDRALCEAYCNTASDEYFKARPQLDSDVNRRIFYAGHRKAWINWQAAHGIKE